MTYVNLLTKKNKKHQQHIVTFEKRMQVVDGISVCSSHYLVRVQTEIYETRQCIDVPAYHTLKRVLALTLVRTASLLSHSVLVTHNSVGFFINFRVWSHAQN